MTEPAQDSKARTEPAREEVRQGTRRAGAHQGLRPPAARTGAGSGESPAASLQRAAGNRAVTELLAGGGQPLAPAVRHDFEERFGTDFSGVRVHDTPRAADIAKELSAKAFAVGGHIAFGMGRFAPDTTDGKQLLAHELAHVLQQSRGGPPPSADATGELEQSAQAASRAAIGNDAGPVAVSGASGVGVACADDELKPPSLKRPGASRRSTRVAPSEQSFADAEFDAILHDVRNSDLGHRLEASKRRTDAPLPEDTTRTRAQVNAAAHAAARRNPPPGRVPGAQIQHQTKTLDVTRNLPPGMNPLDVNVINENTLWLQSRRNLPSTVLHVDPKGGGTRFHVDDVPRGRVGDAGAPGEQLDLFKPSAGPRAPDYNTEHKFMDNYLIPAAARQIAESRRKAGLPPLDPRMLAIAAGEQTRWMATGDPGTTRSGEVVDIAGRASARPAAPQQKAVSPPSAQLELPFGAAPAAPVPEAGVLPVTPPVPRQAPDAAPQASGTGKPVPGMPETIPGTPQAPVQEHPAAKPVPAPEERPKSPEQTERTPGGGLLHAGTQAANEGAALVRGYDTYDEARKHGASAPEAALKAGKTYLENNNLVMSTLANYRAKRQDGQDPIEAALSTGGETLGGFLVPGKGVDQAINAGANLAGAVDDHLKRGDANAAAHDDKANLRTGADFAAGLTPSRMFSGLMGGGLRSYWDIGKAIGGDTKGVDKFADDAVKGKVAMVVQPWAMAADFLGNLGSHEGAGKALEKTVQKSKGSTLEKVGSASGDALFHLGQSDAAKSGKYGGSVQGISMLLSATSDHIAGKSWEQAFEKAAEPGKDSFLAKVGSKGGDLAWAAHEKIAEVADQDVPKMKAAVEEKLDEAKTAVADFKTEAKARVSEVKEAAADRWQKLKQGAASYLPW